MKTIVLAFAIFMLLDVLMFYAFPLPNITLEPDYQCNLAKDEFHREYNFLVVGCASQSRGDGITKIPSFLFAEHEYLHLQGADEIGAYTGTAIHLFVFTWLLAQGIWRYMP